MSRANVGSVPCHASHADDGSRAIVDVRDHVLLGICEGPEGSSTMFSFEPVAARALAQLLLVAAEALERTAIESTRTSLLAIAHARAVRR